MAHAGNDQATRVYIGLGANLGDSVATLRTALAALAALPATRLVNQSALYRSAPVDADGPDYLNAVAALDTGLAAQQLLFQLQAIELRLGRRRSYKNAPRTLDLDLLLYGGQTIATRKLTVPHPRMHERAFVLRPLADIAPGLRLPCGANITELLIGVAGQRADKLDP